MKLREFTGDEYLVEDLLEEMINTRCIGYGMKPIFSEGYIRRRYHEKGFQYWKDSDWHKSRGR